MSAKFIWHHHPRESVAQSVPYDICWNFKNHLNGFQGKEKHYLLPNIKTFGGLAVQNFKHIAYSA